MVIVIQRPSDAHIYSYYQFQCCDVCVEMLVVEELYKEAVLNTTRSLIIFNGELDRIRSGCILHCLGMLKLHETKEPCSLFLLMLSLI